MPVNYSVDNISKDYSEFVNFNKLKDLSFDIDQIIKAFDQLKQTIPLDPITHQICLTHTEKDYKKENLFYEGSGSLTYQWSKDPYNKDGSLKKRETPLIESDFTKFNDELKETYLYEVYNKLSEKYKIGRFRFFQLAPKKCMSWHSDTEKRIHIAVITDPGCRMVIEDESLFMPADGSVFECDTTKFHTAFNGSHKCKRIHLVAGILEK